MSIVSIKDLLNAGVHFGHQQRFWNPKMDPYIFDTRKQISIINLELTQECLNAAASKVLCTLVVSIDANDAKFKVSSLAGFEDNSSTEYNSIRLDVPFRATTENGTKSATRSFFIQKIMEGEDGVDAATIEMDPVSVTFDADSAGTVSSYAAGATTFKVFE